MGIEEREEGEGEKLKYIKVTVVKRVNVENISSKVQNMGIIWGIKEY